MLLRVCIYVYDICWMVLWSQGEPGSLCPLLPGHLHLVRPQPRSRNLALSACMCEMLLCNSHFSLSRCAPLIILFDLTPKRQVMTNKGPELRATVVNNNTSVPYLTPRSFWAGITRDGSSCISEKPQLLDGAFFTSPTPSLSLSAAFQPLNHQ